MADESKFPQFHPTVVAIAKTIYDENRWCDVGILADALSDHPCEDDRVDMEDFEAHLRAPDKPHVRGCRVVDIILGKE